ncbi:MAG: YciI family protein [Burkholderiaceae bacterium]
MLCDCILIDKPNSSALRQEHRPSHKLYLGQVANQVAFAGPLHADDGITMIGSLLVIDFPSVSEAKTWLADEPFTKVGLYARTEVFPFSNLWPQKAGFPQETT